MRVFHVLVVLTAQALLGAATVKYMNRLHKDANGNDAEAQYELGNEYFNVKGVPGNFKKAAEWYGRAARQDHDEAMVKLGYMYAIGKGVDKDLKQAVKYFEMAIEEENTEAMYYMGLLYSHGEGVEKSDDKAIEWWRKAADDEKFPSDKGQFMVGYFYEQGRSVEKSLHKAMTWYEKASEHAELEAAVSGIARIKEIWLNETKAEEAARAAEEAKDGGAVEVLEEDGVVTGPGKVPASHGEL